MCEQLKSCPFCGRQSFHDRERKIAGCSWCSIQTAKMAEQGVALRVWNERTAEMLVRSEQRATLYAVGSYEFQHFIIDRVMGDKKKAIQYADSRANDQFDWEVMQFDVDDEWLYWDHIHTTASNGDE